MTKKYKKLVFSVSHWIPQTMFIRTLDSSFYLTTHLQSNYLLKLDFKSKFDINSNVEASISKWRLFLPTPSIDNCLIGHYSRKFSLRIIYLNTMAPNEMFKKENWYGGACYLGSLP